MAKFKVGEVAIVQGLVTCAEFNGREVVIVGALTIHPISKCSKSGAVYLNEAAYLVRYSDGYLTNVRPANIRKRRPPSTDESTARQAMLDCIQKAKQPQRVSA